MLDPIVFANGISLFFTPQDMKYLFQIVNQELQNINHWFILNKLSLNIKKIKHSFFYKSSQKEDIPLL